MNFKKKVLLNADSDVTLVSKVTQRYLEGHFSTLSIQGNI